MPGLSGRHTAAALILAGLFTQAGAEGIFTCVDGKGRRLTADRPIAECNDREQHELSSSGIVVRKIGPSLTADERAAEEEKQRKAIEESNRLVEEKKRDRALLTRYPDRSVHDKERAGAIASADGVIATAKKHIVDLQAQRQRLDTELEFFKGDPSKTPPKLKRQIEETEQQAAAQKRFIANQEAEKKRINERYDEELVRLKQLWALQAAPVNAKAAASAAVPTTAKR